MFLFRIFVLLDRTGHEAFRLFPVRYQFSSLLSFSYATLVEIDVQLSFGATSARIRFCYRFFLSRTTGLRQVFDCGRGNWATHGHSRVYCIDCPISLAYRMTLSQCAIRRCFESRGRASAPSGKHRDRVQNKNTLIDQQKGDGE